MITSKPSSANAANDVLAASANDVNKTLAVDGFIVGKVGHKVTRTAVSATIDDFRFLDVVFSKTGTTTNTQPTVIAIDNSNILVGMYVFGTGIPDNTTVLSVDSQSQITLSQNATASGSTTLKFANLLYTIRIEYNNSSHDEVDDVERVS